MGSVPLPPCFALLLGSFRDGKRLFASALPRVPPSPVPFRKPVSILAGRETQLRVLLPPEPWRFEVAEEGIGDEEREQAWESLCGTRVVVGVRGAMKADWMESESLAGSGVIPPANRGLDLLWAVDSSSDPVAQVDSMDPNSSRPRFLFFAGCC